MTKDDYENKLSQFQKENDAQVKKLKAEMDEMKNTQAMILSRFDGQIESLKKKNEYFQKMFDEYFAKLRKINEAIDHLKIIKD